MSHYAITAVGRDRPGIVAAVTGVLKDHDCNLEDTSMSILRGHFAMMLVVAGPERLDAAALESTLKGLTSGLDLVVAVRQIDDDVPASPEGDAWTVAVYGVDRPGIVHSITALLADVGVNITDLTTRMIGDARQPVYAMVLEVTLPPSVTPEQVAARLDEQAEALGVECSLHPSEADIL
jgi:glycine cleavage system transcriptional repressor